MSSMRIAWLYRGGSSSSMGEGKVALGRRL